MRIAKGCLILIIGGIGLCPLPGWSQPDWFYAVHITPQTGAFQTELVLVNHSKNTSFPTLSTVDGFEIVLWELPPRQTQIWKPSDFPFENTASIRLRKDDLVEAYVRYSGAGLAEPLWVPVTSQTGRKFRFRANEFAGNWRGMALINLGEGPTIISVRHMGAGAEVLETQVLAEALPPAEKLITLLTPGTDEGQWFEVLSTQPAAVLVLESGRLQNGKDFLKANQPLINRDDILRVTRTGGIVGDRVVTELGGTELCRSTGNFHASERVCRNLTADQVDRLWGLVEEADLFNLVLGESQPDGVCNDAFFYQVEIARDEDDNAYYLEDCEPDRITNGIKAIHFARSVEQFARDILGD